MLKKSTNKKADSFFKSESVFFLVKVIKKTKNGYYKFYTEKWADKLANIER